MNKVMLIGNVGAEPEVRYYDQDQAVARIRLATTERGYTLPNGTQVPDQTDWHTVVMWRGLAKVAETHIHKGDKLYVEGRIRYHYDDKNGQRRYYPEIIAESMEMLSPRQPQQQQQQATTNAPQSQQSAESDNYPF